MRQDSIFLKALQHWRVEAAVLAVLAAIVLWQVRPVSFDRTPYGVVPDFPLGQLMAYPMGVAAAPDGRIYVADKHYHRIQVFSPEGAYLREIGWMWRIKGTDLAQFDRPSALAVGPDGNVYVADVNNNRMQVFSPEGIFLRTWGEMDCDSAPRPPGRFCFQEAVAVGADGTVYVSDSWNNRVQAFRPDGRFLRMWGRNGGDGTAGSGDGEFSRPFYGLAVAPTGPGGAEEIYVADMDNHRVQVFDREGRFLRKWGGRDCGPQAADGRFCNTGGIAVARTGPGGAYEVYVSDLDNNRIQVFTPRGDFVRKWGRKGTAPGEFRVPKGLTAHGDRIIVGDAGNYRIQVFDPQGRFLYGWGSGTGDTPWMFRNVRGVALGGNGRIYVADSGHGVVKVFDAEGRFLRELGKNDCYTRPRPRGTFCVPEGVFVDDEGRVYVTDKVDNRVQIFDSDGKFLDSIGRNGGDGSEGGGDGEFRAPLDVAVDRRGNIFITDSGNNRVQVFSGEPGHGIRFKLQWGAAGAKPGFFKTPLGVAVGPDRLVYVTDYGNHRIQVFTDSGRFVKEIGGRGDRPGQFNRPAAVRLDRRGYIYVTDSDNHRVQKFAPDGKTVVASWGDSGESPGRFARSGSPYGLAVSADGGEVYVTDPFNDRVQKFKKNQPDAIPPLLRHEVLCSRGTPDWCTSNATVRLLATDTGSSVSGVVYLRYRMDAGEWQEYGEPFMVAEEGVHVIRYYAVDNAGNRSSDGLLTLRIDQTPPSIVRLLIDRGAPATLSKQVTITVYASDSGGSGLAGLGVKNPGQAGFTEGPYRNSVEWELEDGVGPQTVQVRVTDAAGNPTVASATIDPRR